jgi:DNA-directed RNA polymerase subunit RPC12/RpoP
MRIYEANGAGMIRPPMKSMTPNLPKSAIMRVTNSLRRRLEEGKILMGEKIKCPYCGSGQIKERVAIRYEDYNKSYTVYRCLECGREFSKKDLEDLP